MDTVKLGQRQIFGMKNTNLMKRVAKYFEQTKNAAQVVEYLVAILLRYALCASDYSLEPLTGLIHQIFLTTTPNDTLRKHCVFFESFFSTDEWQKVVNRLFKNESEYQEFTKETSFYKTYLEKKNREQPEPSEYQYTLISSFKDSNGKKHTWTLRNTKRVSEHLENETANVLKLLTSLTVFQTDSARRFAVYLNFSSHEGRIDAQHKEVQEEVVPTETMEEQTTPRASIENKKPQKQPAAVSTATSKPPYYDEVAAKVEAKYPLPGEKTPTELELSGLESASAIESAENSHELDINYLRYGKTKEQIKEGRKKKELDMRAAKASGKSGKKKPRGNQKKKKGKNKKNKKQK
ncbi:hypothetical protein KQI58_11990 [Enterococcus raffinosus]|uniref:hypothetical protein n=1 Tax=Enterococcus raffinosus TaxID=71452 RepID=UPI001C0F86C6|nr:hypothetical protein [Enterococcus raffinosus]MBU5361794.1 hypothetical protein [Enterococcus raffinosus]